ncbi:MAG: GreA/GreB family elongation factor, partial [Verrucomicrobiota bacterium]
DLRENHEYKAAKEMHKLLMRRKGELENQLVRARGTDFANAKTEAVTIGTVVQVTDLLAQHTETYTILGAWDFDAERHVISYLSPMAQALLGHKPGEEVQYEMDGVKKHYRVDSIGVYKPAAAVALPASAPEAPSGAMPAA